MRRLTTPTITIIFPSDANEYSEILFTFSQQGNIILEKHKEDMTISADYSRKLFSGSFLLTQDETALFDARFVVSAQVRIFKDDKCFASRIYSISVDDVLNEEVMGDGI